MKRQNLRTVSLVVITFTYLLGGAAIFGWLESDSEVRQREHLELIEGLIRRKYNISEDDYKVLWTTIIRSAPHKAGTQWKFPGAFYFATTVVTTIGYGHSTPSTLMGRSFCMLYALIGIPLGLVMFQCIGERLNALVTVALRKLKSCTNAKNQEVTATNKVAVVSVLSLILMTSMAWVFAKYERWDYFDALYYCFITLTTIGFGDYVALQKDAALQSKPEYVIMSLVFILFGLSVVSSAVNLLVLKFLTLNTEDERRDEWLRSTAAQNPIRLEGDVITSPAGKFEYVGGPRPALDPSQQQSQAPLMRQQQPPPPMASDQLVVWPFRSQPKASQRRKLAPEQQVGPQRSDKSFENCSSEQSVSSATVKEMALGLDLADETASRTSGSLQRHRAGQSRADGVNLTNSSNGDNDNESDSLGDEEEGDNEEEEEQQRETQFGYYLHRQSGRPDETCRCQCRVDQLEGIENRQQQQQRWLQPAQSMRLPTNQTIPQLRSQIDFAPANVSSANSLTSFVGSQTKPNSAKESAQPFDSSEGDSLRRAHAQSGRTGSDRTFKPSDGSNCDGDNEPDEQHCRAKHCQERSKCHNQSYHLEASSRTASDWRHFGHSPSTDSAFQSPRRSLNKATPPASENDKQRRRRQQQQRVSKSVIVSSAAARTPVANQSSCSCSWVSLASQSPAHNGHQSDESPRRPTRNANCSSACVLLDAGGLVRSLSQDRSRPVASSRPYHWSSGGGAASLERQALARLAGGVTKRTVGADADEMLPPGPFRWPPTGRHGSEPQDGFLHEVTNASGRHQNDSAKTMISSSSSSSSPSSSSSSQPTTTIGPSQERARKQSFTDDDLDYERRLQSRQMFQLAQWHTTDNKNNSDRQDLELRPSGISQSREMQSREGGHNSLAGVFHTNNSANQQQKRPRPLTAPNAGERRQTFGATTSSGHRESSGSGQKQHRQLAATQKLVCRCCCQHAECIEYAFETAGKQRVTAKANSPPRGAATELAASELARKPLVSTGESSTLASGASETYSEISRTFQQSATTPGENCDKSRTTKPKTPSPPVGQPDLGSNFSAHSEPADNQPPGLDPIVSCDDDGQQLPSTSK